MKNEVQGQATFHLLHRTGISLEEYMIKFHQENIVDMKLQITLSDGSLHTVQVCEMLDALITNFEIDGENIIQEETEDKKKITNINSVIRLAI